MSIMAELPDALRMDLKILATDINHAVVETGRIGQYPGEEVQSVPQRWRDAYMEPVEMAQFSMAREIRRLVTFRQLNLNRDWPFKGQFDVIFCRNVVIYFDDETRNALWKRLAERLVPGGFLYVGHSERVDCIRECHLEAVAPTIYMKKG